MLSTLARLTSRLTFKANDRELTIESSGLARAQIDVGYQALSIIGVDDTEQISLPHIVLFLYAVGLNPTDDAMDSKLRSLKLHTRETFTFAQLCHIWHSMLQDLADEGEILKHAFQFFDKDGNGEISITELRHTMHQLGDLLTEEEIQSFMRVMDVNNDGVIGYEEFLQSLQMQTPPVMEHIATDWEQESPRDHTVLVCEEPCS